MTWIVNAPKRTRQAMALGVFLAFVGAAVGVAWFALSGNRKAWLNIQEKRQTLGRLQAIAALKPSLLQQDNFSMENRPDFLDGESEAVVRGNLQSELGAISAAQRANLLSVGNVPDLEINGSRYIGVRADLSGTIEAVYNSIVAIETTAALSISEASVWRSGTGLTGDATKAPEISAQIHVYGALSPELQNLAAGASQ
jgi:hypothetical protein